MNKTNLVFLDTETTGAGPLDRLCQVAYKFKGQEYEALFKPPVPISVEAMSVSHITNKMVADKEAFENSQMKKDLEAIFASDNILVAHNAQFDVQMLGKEGVVAKKSIDTYKIAHYLDQKCELNRYNLQYLRYYYELEVENAPAHDALGDVRVLEQIFEYYYKLMLSELGDEEKVLIEMLQISERPILVKKFNFGKYLDLFVAEVAINDAGYLRWLLNEKLKLREQGQGSESDDNWIYTLQYHLAGNDGQLKIVE